MNLKADDIIKAITFLLDMYNYLFSSGLEKKKKLYIYLFERKRKVKYEPFLSANVDSLLDQTIDVEDAEKAFFTLLPINQRQSNCLDWKGRKI